MRTFAVGDIHGRYDCLLLALAEIERRAAPARVIFVGDYVDRGPQSREVVACLMRGPGRVGDEWICLKGNHEAMMVDALRKGELGPWLRNGGGATLESYHGTVPPDVLAWCNALPLTHESAHHFFVHAGVRPGIPFAHQSPEEMLWIRDPFLKFAGDFGKHVVHGHTPHDYDPARVERTNRTNLDSGAFYTGRLTVAEFDLDKGGGPIASFEAVAAPAHFESRVGSRA